MSITNVHHMTSTVTTFSTPDQPIVELQRGARKLRVRVQSVEVLQWHGADGREVFVIGPFLKADDTEGSTQKHGLPIVPSEIADLVDQACAAVAL